jgi:homoserine kinase
MKGKEDLQRPKRVELQVPASTSNLGPGFDAIGLALSLHNEFLFERLESGLEIIIEGEGNNILEHGLKNRTYRAFQEASEHLGNEAPGLRIVQHNAIPLARGLGGSGTAVLAGTIAAFLFAGMEMETLRILDQSFTIETHPDNITPSLVGGLTVSTLDDGHVQYLRVIPPSNLTSVILIPEQGLNTAEARRIVPQQFSRDDTIFNIRGAGMLMAALATNQLDNLSLAMRDRLHQPYRSPLMPGMTEIFEAALKAGSPGAALSGAGSGIFAFAYPHNEKAIGDAMKTAAAQFGMDSCNLFLSLNHNGVKVVNLS